MDWKPVSHNLEQSNKCLPLIGVKIFSIQAVIDYIYHQYQKRSIIKRIKRERSTSIIIVNRNKSLFDNNYSVTNYLSQHLLYQSQSFSYHKIHETLPTWLYNKDPVLSRQYIMRRLISSTFLSINKDLDQFLSMNYSYATNNLPLYIPTPNYFTLFSCELASMALLGKNQPLYTSPLFTRNTSMDFNSFISIYSALQITDIRVMSRAA